MKYMMIKNINLVKDKLFKYFLVQVILMIILLYLKHSITEIIDNDLVYAFLGLIKTDSSGAVMMILKVLNLAGVIYVTLKVYLKSMESSLQNTILRMNKYKLLFVNIVSSIMFVIIMRIILLGLMVLFFSIFSHPLSLSFIMTVFIKDILVYSLISVLTILIVNLISLNMAFKLLSCTFIISFVYFIKADISIINGYIILLILIVSLILSVVSFNPIKISNNFKF